MMLKICILMFAVVVLVMGWGPYLTAAAAQNTTQEWKTYLSTELGFQIDYPFSTYTHIFEHDTLPSVLITEDFNVMIDLISLNHTVNEFETFANSTINHYNIEYGRQTLEHLHPVTYANFTGLSATLFNNNSTDENDLIQKFVFLVQDNGIYQFMLDDFQKDYHETEFDKMLNCFVA